MHEWVPYYGSKATCAALQRSGHLGSLSTLQPFRVAQYDWQKQAAPILEKAKMPNNACLMIGMPFYQREYIK